MSQAMISPQLFLEGNIMDIHQPEMFGWHPHKEEKPKTKQTSEPSPISEWSVISALVLLVLVMAGLTGYYFFSEYLSEVFKTWP